MASSQAAFINTQVFPEADDFFIWSNINATKADIAVKNGINKIFDLLPNSETDTFPARNIFDITKDVLKVLDKPAPSIIPHDFNTGISEILDIVRHHKQTEDNSGLVSNTILFNDLKSAFSDFAKKHRHVVSARAHEKLEEMRHTTTVRAETSNAAQLNAFGNLNLP